MPSATFLHDHQMVVYHLDSGAREEVEKWAELVVQVGNDWPKNQAYYSIHDFTQVPMLSPSIRYHAQQLNVHFMTKRFPGMFIAIVIQPTIFLHLIRLFVDRDLKSSKIKRRLFTDFQEAEQWLLACLKNLVE